MRIAAQIGMSLIPRDIPALLVHFLRLLLLLFASLPLGSECSLSGDVCQEKSEVEAALHREFTICVTRPRLGDGQFVTGLRDGLLATCHSLLVLLEFGRAVGSIPSTQPWR